MNENALEDLKLLTRIARGEELAVVELEERYQARLMAYARVNLYSQLRRQIDPEDILQMLWQRIMTKVRGYLINTRGLSPEQWLFCQIREVLTKIHQRFLGTEMRNLNREFHGAAAAGEESGSFLSNLSASQTSPSQGAMRHEKEQHLHTLLAQLSEADREILRLRYFQELSTAEAAEQLGISVKTAHARYGRAMERLEKLLGDRKEWVS